MSDRKSIWGEFSEMTGEMLHDWREMIAILMLLIGSTAAVMLLIGVIVVVVRLIGSVA